MATYDQLLSDLSDRAKIRRRGFRLASELCQFVASEEEELAQELVLRALEHRDAFGESARVVQALAREIGLFPYLAPETLPLADLIAYECHRPPGLGEELVMHHRQAVVYHKLMDGQNVVLSAPTSFGKSLVIDALLGSGRYRNVVVVVPTLALIDETRRRLTRRFAGRYKVITHRSQTLAERNVFVLTQERALEQDRFNEIDLFVIDEFYKLNPANGADERALLLNQAFYLLHKRAKQFYMLGPFIEQISSGFRSRVECQFLHETFHTVTSELHERSRGDDEQAALVALCRELSEPTIIYCRSPNRAAEVSRWLAEADLGQDSRELADAAEWCGARFHPEWHFAVALRQGIGVHHGRIPRSLAQYVVRLFNDEKIRYLVCTSTLIEGVNTQAKNIIVFDNQLDRRRLDLFTFNNIRGRSGRMMRHFVGRVFVFDTPPDGPLPEVDVPVISQPDDTPESLLIQISDDELTTRSRERLQPYVSQQFVSMNTLRANRGVPLDQQIALAREISGAARVWHPLLAWTRTPSYDQLEGVCDLMWRYFNGGRLVSRAIRSSRQLAFFVHELYSRPLTRDLIRTMIGNSDGLPEEFITRTMDFLRLWANFHFPKLLRAIDLIQRDVFSRQSRPLATGNYEYFAAQVENFFFDPALVALDEYGIPLEVARQIEFHLQPSGNVDDILQRLRALDVSTLRLTAFEKSLIRHAQQGL